MRKSLVHGAIFVAAPFLFTVSLAIVRAAPTEQASLVVGGHSSGFASYAHVLAMLYAADSEKPIARSQVDGHGDFLIIAPRPNGGSLNVCVRDVTTQAKQCSASLDIDRQGHAFVQLSGKPELGPNIAYANWNFYARTAAFFLSDRAFTPTSGFANERDPNWTLRGGSMAIHVARGSECDLGPEWSCEPQRKFNDDAYVDGVQLDAGGDAIANLRKTLVTYGIQHRGTPIFLFVHGFNNSFYDGAASAGRASIEIEKRPHVTVFYSWPSVNEYLGYLPDHENARESARRDFSRVVAMLADLPGHPKVVIAAHSMGALVVVEALNQWSRAHRARSNVLERIVFFAGDVGKTEWAAGAAAVLQATQAVRVYTNGNDAALAVSRCLYHLADARLGQPQTVIDQDKITVYDATHVAPYGDAGHAYFEESLNVAQDLNDTVAGPSGWKALATLPWLGTHRGLPTLQQIGSSAFCAFAKKLRKQESTVTRVERRETSVTAR